jgi:hypothetical protein
MHLNLELSFSLFLNRRQLGNLIEQKNAPPWKQITDVYITSIGKPQISTTFDTYFEFKKKITQKYIMYVILTLKPRSKHTNKKKIPKLQLWIADRFNIRFLQITKKIVILKRKSNYSKIILKYNFYPRFRSLRLIENSLSWETCIVP